MRPNYRLNILHVSILAALFLTLDADRVDRDCEDDVRVPRNTVYKAVLGEDLRINCTVKFCNDSPPTVTWYKREETDVPVDVSRSSHITTEWELLNQSEGISFLIFQKISRNDSGVYQCGAGVIVSHAINVSVHDAELTTGTWMTLEPESPTVQDTFQDTFWPYVYRVVGIMAFVIIVLAVYVGSRCECKGGSRDTPDLSHQPSHDAATTHIYENHQLMSLP